MVTKHNTLILINLPQKLFSTIYGMEKKVEANCH